VPIKSAAMYFDPETEDGSDGAAEHNAIRL
jgi:hypothetical protein